MKRYIIFICLIQIAMAGYSQAYYRSVGARAMGISGITYKKFLREGHAWEGIASLGFSKAQLYVFRVHQKYSPAADLPEKFELYYGYGGHMGIGSKHGHGFLFFPCKDNNSRSFFQAGLNGMLGMEYKFDDYPLTISADFIPEVGIGVFNPFIRFNSSVSVALRYIF
jgi:hypothetical protein